MDNLADKLKATGFNERTTEALVQLVRDSEAKALMLFGSFDDGETWKHSDIDLFLISNLSPKHTAFFKKVDEALLHINVCSEKDFRAYLDKPTGRTIHALFVNGNLLYDKTDWIENERQRLADYPLQNKVLQICERLEGVLHQFYQMKKGLFFRPLGKTTEGRLDSLLKLFEAEQISAGVYYGKTVLKALGEQEHKLLEETEKLNDCDFINRVQPRLESLLNAYLPLLMAELKMIDDQITQTNICDCLGIDLHYLPQAALNRGLLEVVSQETKTHGFAVAEEVYLIKGQSG